MSALANSISPNHLIPKLSEDTVSQSGTHISVTARIDYNLRFTKQAVLVVGNTTEEYTQLASQFLVSLSDIKPQSGKISAEQGHINVAFISSSSKLNDIQIRCRLIEQLFVKTLFDPEQSLAVSVLKFAKEQRQAISIVVDHAHSLSLQVKYELCQLVNLAKKHKLTINVVLFGLVEAAQQLAVNKSLFKNKLALIDASSGQVINLNSTELSSQRRKKNFTFWHKITLATAILLLTAACFWLYLLIKEDIQQQEKSNESVKIESKSNFKHSLEVTSVSNEETATVRAMQKKYKMTSPEEYNSNDTTLSLNPATSEDIHQALIIDPTSAPEKIVPAKIAEVLHAIVVHENRESHDVVVSQSEAKTKEYTSVAAPNNHYYQLQAKQYPQGFVVQIAGFADEKLLKRFLTQNMSENLYHYQRMMAGKKLTIVTTKVYSSKAEAKAAITKLPQSLLERKPWLKAISSVVDEINTFKQ